MASSSISFVLFASLLVLSATSAYGEAPQCSLNDISITQREKLSKWGEKEFVVEIKNVGKVPVFDVDVWCNDFKPKRIIDPDHAFRKLSPETCYVWEGRTLVVNDKVSFIYVNDFRYDLSPRQVRC